MIKSLKHLVQHSSRAITLPKIRGNSFEFLKRICFLLDIVFKEIFVIFRRGRKRIRAHANPFSSTDMTVPLQPRDIDWKKHFIVGEEFKVKRPNICDVGCGFGNLILTLGGILPDDLVIGLEIRPQAVAIVKENIKKAREGGKAKNVSVINCNVMKHFAHYFLKGQLDKIFFTFPDPHFKKSNHRRRIINQAFLAYYAFALRIGGLWCVIAQFSEIIVQI